MLNFTYFDQLDEVGSRECCIVAQMKSYDTNETIMGDGQGVPNYVYFVLQGRCQMIESIQVITTTRVGRSFYTLYDPYVPKEKSEVDLDKKYFDQYTNQITVKSSEEIKAKGKRVSSRIELSGILKTPGASYNPSRTASSMITTFETPIVSPSRIAEQVALEINKKFKRESSATREWLPPSSKSIRESTRFSQLPQSLLRPRNIRTYFMQVCQMIPGASFGFGENMRDRRIVALSPVKCMLLPKVWLLQRNTANIWTRIQYYLEKKIPNKKALFDEFVSIRRWEEYCGKMTQACKTKPTYTTRHDVPFSVRLTEALDDM